ncbi:unnamed protein product [Bodo saltans]|uniref:Tyr recombinase domain-containing protein n=1 Tax=Bodo saltans TaxID=75058 RepID=A0A0S4JKR2_BODSA|nr:unnamed protein product [Bodo saltans]|eukprot:CUG90816.1 unnamed protein product [Bodo saltans]
MPRKAKLDPRAAARKACHQDPKEARRILVDRAVQPQSLKQYEPRFVRMESFRRELGVESWSTDLFVAWLFQMKEAGYKNSEGYRAALIHCLEARGESTACLRTPEVLKMTQGFSLQTKLARKPIGAVTSSMFAALCRWLRDKKEEKLAILAAVIFYSQARGEEVMRMRKGDLQADGDSKGFYLWFVRNDKRCKRDNAFAKSTQKLVPERVMTLINHISREQKLGEVVFSAGNGFCLKRLATHIREASRELAWPAEVHFGGVHGLRHGGSRALMERARDAVATGMANQTKGTLRYYAKANPK